MAAIRLEAIAHSYAKSGGAAADYALKPLSQEWHDGGVYALLGPSGCGKTTLLNIISGLIQPSEGRIYFDGVDVTGQPTSARNIAQVFQFPVVYDSMTVADNLAFPLRNRGMKKTAVADRIARVMEMLELTAISQRKARNLDAGTRQIISLGRGLVRTDARAILFDEPLTVVDPALKWQIRAKLKEVQREFGHTMIYVTHDQTEALTFADEVAVMAYGEILQSGSPQELFDNPAHTFVGQLIGSPGMNLLPCTLEGNRARIGTQLLPIPFTHPVAGDSTQLGIRPEYLKLVEQGSSTSAIPCHLIRVEDRGRYRLAHLHLNELPVQALIPESTPLPTQPALVIPEEHLRVYQQGRLLGQGSGVNS